MRIATRLVTVAAVFTVVVPLAGEEAPPPGDAVQPVLLIHGGAGTLRPGVDEEAAYRQALAEALYAGWAVLAEDGGALDAVETAVRVMEDSPLFNAGRGAVLTSDGRAELDASIMDGATRAAGAVAAVERIKNPIAAARAVMQRTPHVLLVGSGADRWAADEGLETVTGLYFYTERRFRAVLEQAAEASGPEGTVGAVALDRHGHLAAATSTGGLTGKLPGRVGDSPIPGAGNWADAGCAVSGTGRGELFLRYTVARDVCARREYQGRSVEEAADAVVEEALTAMEADGGVIVLAADGDWTFSFNTPTMLRGRIAGDGEASTWLYTETDPVIIEPHGSD